MDPESFNHRTEKLLTGRIYHFVDQVPQGYNKERHPTLLCIHGFPDLWYGWRYQIGPWVRRGYRVTVPDMLGYGGSSKPTDTVEYSTKKLCADMAALLDLLNIERAVIIGHDWGSVIAARFALWHPNRVLALVLLSIPYTPPSLQYLSLDTIVQRAPNLGYQIYFASPESNSEILENLRGFLCFAFATGTTDFSHSTILTDEEFEYYYSQHRQGMHGPLNYYRTTKIRYEEERASNLPSNIPDDIPVLFLWGTRDEATTRSLLPKVKKFIKHYQEISLEGRGHWLMVEAKDDVTNKVAQWIDSLMPQAKL